MANPFIAEIVMFGGNFAPRSWAFCNGQLLPIAQNTALFSLIGTIYGGDGRVTTGLPDLRGRSPLHLGTGPGLPTYKQGSKGGTETNTLNSLTMASHSHGVTYAAATIAQGANNSGGNDADPNGRYPSNSGDEDLYSDAAAGSMGAPTVSATTTLANTGSQSPQAVNNMQPFQVVNFIIALQGTYPSRS